MIPGLIRKARRCEATTVTDDEALAENFTKVSYAPPLLL